MTMSKQSKLSSDRLLNLHNTMINMFIRSRDQVLDQNHRLLKSRKLQFLDDLDDSIEEAINADLGESIYEGIQGVYDPFEDGKFYNQVLYRNIYNMLVCDKPPLLMCIKEKGQCPVCLDVKPLSVVCFKHQVCSGCVKKMKQNGLKTCPVCRNKDNTINGTNSNIWFGE